MKSKKERRGVTTLCNFNILYWFHVAPAELTRLAGQSELLDIRKALLLSGSSSRSAADKSRILEWSFCRFTRGDQRKSEKVRFRISRSLRTGGHHTSNLSLEGGNIICLLAF